jgi:hypothetical protein
MPTSRTFNVQAQILSQISQRTRLVVSGHGGLVALRTALRRAVREFGVSIVLAPETPDSVVDWLALPAMAGVAGALRGASLGLLLGILLNRLGAGMLFGGVVGAAVGALTGASAVANGWRLRVDWLPSGIPQAIFEPVELEP